MLSLKHEKITHINASDEYLNKQSIPEEIISEAKLQQKWNYIKAKREDLLSATDYTQVNDTPLSEDDKEKFKMYRQALRDLPQSFENPEDVVWPNKPE